MENWKDIKGYEGSYQVSDLGRVKSLRYGNILNPYINSVGYKVVNLSENTKRVAKKVHSLVAECFLNHTPNGYKLVVDHINNIKTDNSLNNLQIITHRENCSKDKRGYSSKYVGVSYNKKNKKWISMISIDSKLNYLGSFNSEERASIAYNFALIQTDKLTEYNITKIDMSNTYKFGSGTWARKKGSTLAYSDTNNAFKPLPFSFERNSIATRVNKEGLIEVVGNDIPRIDYTDSTEGALLLENSSTNLFLNSNDFTQWGQSSITVQGGQIGVGGSSDAFLLTALGDGQSRIAQNKSTSGLHTASFYAKKSTSNYLVIYGIGSGDPRAFFDLEKGIVGTTSLTTSTSMTPMGDGWYRCEMTYTVSVTTSFWIFVADEDNVFNSPSGSSIYLQYGQLEQGNASSYIPTNGSTVQRSAETCSDSGNSEVFNDSQGVLFANISALANDGTNRVLSLSNGGYSNSIRIQYYSVSNQLEFRVVSSGSAVVLQRVTISDTTLFNKILVKYKLNDFALWANGFEILTDINGATPIGLNEIRFDDGDGNVPFYGKTKEIAYYDTALTDEELEYMTSYRSLNEMVTELNLNAL